MTITADAQTTIATDLWVSDTGEVTCREHAGFYLSEAIQMAEQMGERRRTFHTPLGTQRKVTERQAAEWREARAGITWGQGHLCETCAVNAEEALAAAEAQPLEEQEAPALTAAQADAVATLQPFESDTLSAYVTRGGTYVIAMRMADGTERDLAALTGGVEHSYVGAPGRRASVSFLRPEGVGFISGEFIGSVNRAGAR